MKKYYFYFILFTTLFCSQVFAQAPVINPISGPLTVCSTPASAKSYTAFASNSPTSYAWSSVPSTGISFSNSNGSVTDIDFTYTNVTNTTYTITCSATNGFGTSAVTAIVVTVLETPTVIFSGSNNFCQGSSTNLSASPTSLSASSTITYNWSPFTGLNSTTGSNVTAKPLSSTTYTVLYAIGSCTNSTQLAVNVNPFCTYVWPGDVNNDGVANNLDVLELGLHFNQAGAQRIFVSNNWNGYNANLWSGTTTNGNNLNYSDCNGDGMINLNDTLAIFNNYGLLHSKPNFQTSANPLLSIVADQTTLYGGTWGSASVFLGDAANIINTINGLAFTISYDQAQIEPNSFYIEYPASFLNASNQNLKFSKLNFSSGLLYTALTHTNNVNVNGFGKIAVLHYRINANLASNSVLTIGLSQVNQSNASGFLTPLSSGTATIATLSSVGINELTDNANIFIYPNPAKHYLTVTGSNSIKKIEILNVAGQLILSETASGNSHQLNIETLVNGVYFVSIYNSDNTVYRKKLVVQN